ncbi:MAG: glycosyltransferase family 2 protein [Azospirillaceae bacterium]|nr:glycosyltransferase family 2 protein [Azospirillaceae bacterium]
MALEDVGGEAGAGKKMPLPQETEQAASRLSKHEAAVQARMRRRVDTILASNTEPAQAVAALTAALLDMAQSSASLYEAERHARARLAQLEAQSQRQAQDLQATVEDLRAQLRGMRSSTSWRVTAPLRTVMARFPGPIAQARRKLRWVWWALTGQLAVRRARHKQLVALRKLLLAEGVFDTSWYMLRYRDVMVRKIDPVLDYLTGGAAANRDPSPTFSTAFYVEQNPDVAVSGLNPLEHYVLRGRAEGRIPHPSLRPKVITSRFSQDPEYEAWITANEVLTEEEVVDIEAAVDTMPVRPLISVIMPVYNPPLIWLERAIESVRAQSYGDWELCIADDASTDPQVAVVLRRYAQLDARIKIVFREKNGHISAACNSALGLATGDYVALLDNDDELPRHALFWVAAEVAAHPDIDALYSDEDKIDVDGMRSDPYFKSDWSPTLMLAQNAFSHLGVFRRGLVEELGGFRVGFEGSQDHDLILRVAEVSAPDRIRHIPRVLYHWRILPGSTATAGDEKPYAWRAGKRAVEEHLARRGIAATVSPGPGNYYQVDYAPETFPRVSIIIPTRDRLDLLRGCIDSLQNESTYPDVEIIVVDNGSVEPETLSYLARLQARGTIRVLRDDGPFNYSRLNNRAAEMATGDYLCLLNNDTLVITPDWLQRMMAHAVQPDVGAVGAMLYFADDTIQHAGVTIGMGGVAGHIHRLLPRGSAGYFGRAAVAQDLSAVTGACLVTRRSLYLALGGLNERDLTIAFNDVDYCLRVRESDSRVIWTPMAELYHLESVSRGNDTDPDKIARFKAEIAYMMARWPGLIDDDPYFNPNFDLYSSVPRMAAISRVRRLP